MKKSILALSALLVLVAPVAFADSMDSGSTAAPTATQSINDNHILLNVMNPTANAVTFSVADLSISDMVPAKRSRTFYIDLNMIKQRQLTYNVNDNAGNLLSSGTLNNPTAVDNTALDSIINYSTAYSAPVQPEPVYHERTTSYTKTTTETEVKDTPAPKYIRGYW